MKTLDLINDFSVEFQQTYKEDIKPMLHKLFQKIKKNNFLIQDMKSALL